MLRGMTTKAKKANKKNLAIGRISLPNFRTSSISAIKTTMRKVAINRRRATHFNMAIYINDMYQSNVEISVLTSMGLKS